MILVELGSLNRTLEKLVEDPISSMILKGELKGGETIHVKTKGDKIEISTDVLPKTNTLVTDRKRKFKVMPNLMSNKGENLKHL